MPDREKVINELRSIKTYLASQAIETTDSFAREGFIESQKDIDDAIALLKEQEKKPIKVHKKHVISCKRNDVFTMRHVYEAVCQTLLEEGELIIGQTDDHEKVEFVFYVTE